MVRQKMIKHGDHRVLGASAIKILLRHCEEQSDVAIHIHKTGLPRSLMVARNDAYFLIRHPERKGEALQSKDLISAHQILRFAALSQNDIIRKGISHG